MEKDVSYYIAEKNKIQTESLSPKKKSEGWDFCAGPSNLFPPQGKLSPA